YRLQDGQGIYGQGIWAPCLRHHRGRFLIFTNIRGQNTHIFSAVSAAGPWQRTVMKRGFHDPSVLFDDDGSAHIVWGYRDIRYARLNDELSDLVPGTEKALFPSDSPMGEGAHFYKVDGRYYITSAWYDGKMRMACARADRPEGPYEVNPAISLAEDFGLGGFHGLAPGGPRPPFKVNPPGPGRGGARGLHQGGIVSTPKGVYWGFSHIDYGSVGRLTCLAPITWHEGWPYFGLPGNLGRTPRIWAKPDTGSASAASAPYGRGDDFPSSVLQPVWQWNHAPDDSKWSLTERPGFLRLHSLPAPEFWSARNTLTQRAVGPASQPTVVLETAGMRRGDLAGLGLLNFPYAWIGVRRTEGGCVIEQYDQTTGEATRAPLGVSRVLLRVRCDFLTEKARFSYSTDGKAYAPLGGEFTPVYQLRTFQGVRYALFHYNLEGQQGGYADFDSFTLEEPYPHGLRGAIPAGESIRLSSLSSGDVLVAERHLIAAVPEGDARAASAASSFTVIDRGQGRVALNYGDAFISVTASGTRDQLMMRKGPPTDRETFQWIETPYGYLVLLSLSTHRYLRVEPSSKAISADSPGPHPNRGDGTWLRWALATDSNAKP
ncbi:MAG TPA: family 43 glycosylhydrolase, partial [Armatimonadota bacterium]